MKAIVAVSQKNVIGYNNDLPWPPIKEDLRHFKKITLGNPIIMGRKTFESIGRPLPGRKNIVLSRSPINCKDIHWANNKNLALELCEGTGYIIGGSAVYKLFSEDIDTWYITQIKKAYKGDTFLPPLDFSLWKRECLKETETAIYYCYSKSSNL